MADTFVRVEGLQAIGEAMRALSLEVNNKIARQATGAAANLVKKQTVTNIITSPAVDTGSLRDSVIVKKIPNSQTLLTSEHIVTFRGKNRRGKKAKTHQAIAPHAHFIEFGTRNMPAEPVLRPAFEQEKGFAVAKIKSILQAGIERAVAGLKR